MRAFFGGQIKPECRGDLAAVITHEDHQSYAGFVYHPFDDKEFIHLTGIRNISSPVERVYIGISQNSANLVMREKGALNTGTITLERIDEQLVFPHFLKQQPERHKRLVIVADNGGTLRIEESE